MKIVSVEDQEDGSAIVTLDLTPDEHTFLLEYAFNDIVRKGMEVIKEEDIDHEIQRGS